MSKSDDNDDMDAGMTTAERRRRKRRNSGLRVPSDNVPRRNAVVAPIPEDPSLAVSIAYSFASEGSEPLRMDGLEPIFEASLRTTLPGFAAAHKTSFTPSFDARSITGSEPAAPDAAATLIERVADGNVDDPGFEIKTREMLAVDLDALGLREAIPEPSPSGAAVDISAVVLTPAGQSERNIAPRIVPPAISEPIPQLDNMQERSVSAGWSQPSATASLVRADSSDEYESFETATTERPAYRESIAPARLSTVALADNDLDDLVDELSNTSQRAARDSMEISVDFDERSTATVEPRARQTTGPRPSAPPEPPPRPSAKVIAPAAESSEAVRVRPTSTPPTPSGPAPSGPAALGIAVSPAVTSTSVSVSIAPGPPPPPPPQPSPPQPSSAPPPPPPHATSKAPPAPPPKVDKSADRADKDRDKEKDQRSAKNAKTKSWFTEVFDEDYLKTLPFLTPQSTQAEAEFVLAAMDLAPGAQVLDIGCGYGRHAMEMAARGFHVVGLDLSLPLLVRGGEEAHRRGLTINFVRGDMRELDFDNQFDGAYCLFSSFGYFDDDTNKKTALNIARALRPGGKLVLEILNRDYIVADLPTRVWWEGEGCVVLEEVDFNYFFSRVVVNRSLVMDDGRQLEQEISIRAYSLHEIGRVLHGAGFRVLEISGGYQTRGRFFGNQSRHIVIVAEKKND